MVEPIRCEVSTHGCGRFLLPAKFGIEVSVEDTPGKGLRVMKVKLGGAAHRAGIQVALRCGVKSVPTLTSPNRVWHSIAVCLMSGAACRGVCRQEKVN